MKNSEIWAPAFFNHNNSFLATVLYNYTVFIGYKWSAWSSYTTCSKDCSDCSEQYCKGTKYRTRKCGGDVAKNLCLSDPNKAARTTDYKQTISCKTVDCCKANDKFTCGNYGKCIGFTLNKQSVKNKWVNRETVTVSYTGPREDVSL